MRFVAVWGAFFALALFYVIPITAVQSLINVSLHVPGLTQWSKQVTCELPSKHAQGLSCAFVFFCGVVTQFCEERGGSVLSYYVSVMGAYHTTPSDRHLQTAIGHFWWS